MKIFFPYLEEFVFTATKADYCPACGRFLYGFESYCPECGINFGVLTNSSSNFKDYLLKIFFREKR
jgi:uncharacterized OB-fold protein